MPLPSTERILLGPGPSLMPPRVIGALAAPVLSHLDPDFVPLMDELQGQLRRLFGAGAGVAAAGAVLRPQLTTA
jgi:aspartate aminotransferase-like enzyme